MQKKLSSALILVSIWALSLTMIRPALAVATIASCNAAGNPKDYFNTGDTVYAKGSGYAASTSYDIYIVTHRTWIDQMSIAPYEKYNPNGITSDGSGNVAATAIWPPTLKVGSYDIVVDVDKDGKYDSGEPLDNMGIYNEGFTVSEAPMGFLMLLALGFGVVFIVMRSKRRTNLIKP